MISQLSKANCKAQIFSAAVAEGGGDDNDNNNNNLIYKAPYGLNFRVTGHVAARFNCT